MVRKAKLAHPCDENLLATTSSIFTLANGRAYTFDQNQPGEALTYSGVAVIHPGMFAGLENGKRPLAPLLKQAMLEQQISASKMQGVWVDVGTPERLNVLDQQIKQGLYD